MLPGQKNLAEARLSFRKAMTIEVPGTVVVAGFPVRSFDVVHNCSFETITEHSGLKEEHSRRPGKPIPIPPSQE